MTSNKVQYYEIWLGRSTFISQGEHSRKEPYFLGKELGKTFQDACIHYLYKSRVKVITQLINSNESLFNISNCIGFDRDTNFLKGEGYLYSSYEEALKEFEK